MHEGLVACLYFDDHKGSRVECDDVRFEVAGQPVLSQHKSTPSPDV